MLAQTLFKELDKDGSGGLSPQELEAMVGEKAIAKYGCTGCHEIKGFEGAGPIGTELTTWGDKFATQLDFGHFFISSLSSL